MIRLVAFAVPLLLLFACGGDSDDTESDFQGDQMVDIGGYSLHINCQGEGSPAIILDGGTGVDAETWSLLQSTWEGDARICAYSRAGVGQSEPRPDGPATGTDLANELHTLLDEAGVEPPIILAGHSAGGLYIRNYRELYPEDVAGLVFVDSSHEDQFPTDLAAGPGWNDGDVPVNLSDLEETLPGASPLGDLPVVVLHGPLIEDPDPQFPEFWLGVHRKQAALSSNSILASVIDAGHYIQLDDPVAVAAALSAVLQAARDDGPIASCEEAFARLPVECLAAE